MFNNNWVHWVCKWACLICKLDYCRTTNLNISFKINILSMAPFYCSCLVTRYHKTASWNRASNPCPCFNRYMLLLRRRNHHTRFNIGDKPTNAMEIQSVILKLMATRISIVYYRHMDLDQFIPHMCVTIDCVWWTIYFQCYLSHWKQSTKICVYRLRYWDRISWN